MTHYNIGDEAWVATHESVEKRAECPECCGKKYITVIMGDGTEHTIQCAGCSAGFNPATGFITYREFVPLAKPITISGVELSKDGVEYKYDELGCMCRISDGKNVFGTKEEAEIRANEMADEHNKKATESIKSKDFRHQNRTWSWHVHYYRKMIRDAKKNIEFAESRLDYAKVKAKEA